MRRASLLQPIRKCLCNLCQHIAFPQQNSLQLLAPLHMMPAHRTNMLRWLVVVAFLHGLASPFRLPSMLQKMNTQGMAPQRNSVRTSQKQPSSAHSLPADSHTASSMQDHTPGIELAARQYLFNYATQQGIDILKDRISQLDIPPISKSFNLPLVGDFTLQLSELRVTSFNASSDEARLSILDGHFELWITQVRKYPSHCAFLMNIIQCCRTKFHQPWFTAVVVHEML